MTAEISAYDLNIRHYQNAAQARRDMAEYLLSLAAKDLEQVDYWTGLRDEALGNLALNNVSVLRGATGGGDAA